MTQTTPPRPIAQRLLHTLARARGQKIVDLKAFATARRSHSRKSEEMRERVLAAGAQGRRGRA